MLTYTGFLKVKGEEQKISDRFRKREFVLTDNSSVYPQTILFQLTQDRCELIDAINVGDEITVHFQLKGRKWRTPQGEVKYFNSLEVFKIERVQSVSENVPAHNFNDNEHSDSALTPDDSLPF
jgi:hypothetical protein